MLTHWQLFGIVLGVAFFGVGSFALWERIRFGYRRYLVLQEIREMQREQFDDIYED